MVLTVTVRFDTRLLAVGIDRGVLYRSATAGNENSLQHKEDLTQLPVINPKPSNFLLPGLVGSGFGFLGFGVFSGLKVSWVVGSPGRRPRCRRASWRRHPTKTTAQRLSLIVDLGTRKTIPLTRFVVLGPRRAPQRHPSKNDCETTQCLPPTRFAVLCHKTPLRAPPKAPRFSRSFLGVLSRMPSSTLIPFLGGLGSLINPFKQKRAPFSSLGYWAA